MDSKINEVKIRSESERDSYIAITPSPNIDGSYSMLLSDYALNEINKSLVYIFKKREAARKYKNIKRPSKTDEFELCPIQNLNGSYTVNITEYQLEEIIQALRLLESQRLTAKKYGQKIAAEKKKQLLEEQSNYRHNYENTIIKQNPIKLRVINPV